MVENPVCYDARMKPVRHKKKRKDEQKSEFGLSCWLCRLPPLEKQSQMLIFTLQQQ